MMADNGRGRPMLSDRSTPEAARPKRKPYISTALPCWAVHKPVSGIPTGDMPMLEKCFSIALLFIVLDQVREVKQGPRDVTEWNILFQ